MHKTRTFCGTFKQSSRLKDNYVKIRAVDYEEAHDTIKMLYPDDYSMIYSEDKFDPEFYPAGKL